MNHSDNENRGRLLGTKRDSSGSHPKGSKGFQGPSEDELNDTFPDYPIYPPNEDIYSIYTKEDEVDIEHPYQLKSTADRIRQTHPKEFEGEISGDDLDIPGAELDDEQEFIGSEDEENNYYSLGGDNHDDLDEFKGDEVD